MRYKTRPSFATSVATLQSIYGPSVNVALLAKLNTQNIRNAARENMQREKAERLERRLAQ